MGTNTEELQILIDVDNSEKEQDASKQLTVEEIQTKLKAIDTDPEQDNINKIAITKEIFEQIRKSLAETVKSMEKNPSLFSRAAEFWGELPLWQKILGGVALTVPTLLIGIAANIGFLLAICGVTAVTYAAGGIILDDHHKCSTSIIESLQKGILGLADLLELTINALEIIRQQLEAEIEKFAKENERLTENINALSEQIDAIDLQVKATSKINESLSGTKDGLDKAADFLKENVLQQTDLLQQNQQKLDRINEAYSTSQRELSEKISEINKVRKELGEDLECAKGMIDTLGSTLTEFSSTIGNEEKRQAFQKKLEVFLTDKEASFLQVADRICLAEQKLAIVQKELESTNARYQELLKIQGQHIDRLEGLGSLQPQTTSVGKGLSHNGLFAVKEDHSTDTKEHKINTELQCN